MALEVRDKQPLRTWSEANQNEVLASQTLIRNLVKVTFIDLLDV